MLLDAGAVEDAGRTNGPLRSDEDVRRGILLLDVIAPFGGSTASNANEPVLTEIQQLIKALQTAKASKNGNEPHQSTRYLGSIGVVWKMEEHAIDNQPAQREEMASFQSEL